MTARFQMMLGVVVICGALFYIWRRDSRPPNSAATQLGQLSADRNGASSTGRALGAAVMAESIARELVGLQAARQNREDTFWRTEAQSQRHEDVWIEFWDQLRRSENPWRVIHEMRVERVEYGELGAAENVGAGIQQRRGGNARISWSESEWRQWLGAWEGEGWKIQQTSWRHIQFIPTVNPGGAHRSVVRAEVNLERVGEPGRERRLASVRGDLDVEWRVDAEGKPQLGRVRVLRLHHLARGGDPGFELWVQERFPMTAQSGNVPTLVVDDKDGDGRLDVMLPEWNRWYRNRGDGKFESQRLVDLQGALGEASVWADFTGDGRADLLMADRQGLTLFAGEESGGLRTPGRQQRLEGLLEPFLLTPGDVDGDGDLDVYLGQYRVPYRGGQMPTPYWDANDGYPGYFLRNDGVERGFTDVTVDRGLGERRFRRTYSGSWVDLNRDGRLDLVRVSDFAGVDVAYQRANGVMRWATASEWPEPNLFGMGHVVADFDGDLFPDLMAIGMTSYAASRFGALGLGVTEFPEHLKWRGPMTAGNRVWLNRVGGFARAPFEAQVADSGWSWGGVAADFDNDGKLELAIANGHISNASVRDYDAEYWKHDNSIVGSGLNAARDQYFAANMGQRFQAGESYGGHERNRFWIQSAPGVWVEVAYLLGVAVPLDSRSMVAADLDGDGGLELIMTTEESWPQRQHRLLIFRNRLSRGNWFQVDLGKRPSGKPDAGAAVELELEGGSGQAVRYRTYGDSFRSQHPSVLHFGLGDGGKARRLRMRVGQEMWEVSSGGRQNERVVWNALKPQLPVNRSDSPGP